MFTISISTTHLNKAKTGDLIKLQQAIESITGETNIKLSELINKKILERQKELRLSPNTESDIDLPVTVVGSHPATNLGPKTSERKHENSPTSEVNQSTTSSVTAAFSITPRKG